jgi:ubiquitin carboxyl-terminal hydrolase 5/13
VSKFDGQVQSLAAAESPFKKSAAIAWELEIFPCEHTLTVVQSPVNKDLSKCASCDLSTNLWLCLTCGNTGCGRKNWDGSGGNNHAIDHFETTKHPLVVKLGTITAEGDASVYCYACDNDVKDDNLTEHLAVLGIRIESQKKTEKTMVEMTLDYNLNFSLGRLVDNSEKSIKMYGPEYTGMNNIGNSCYLNSVVQTLNSLPEFR